MQSAVSLIKNLCLRFFFSCLTVHEFSTGHKKQNAESDFCALKLRCCTRDDLKALILV